MRHHLTKFSRPVEPPAPDFCTLGVTLGKNSNFVKESESFDCKIVVSTTETALNCVTALAS